MNTIVILDGEGINTIYRIYRNANGEWYRDETVEFDSDEEIPIPPDYVNH